MTKEDFLKLKAEEFTFKEIGEFFGLTERQVNYRTRQWGLDYSKKKHVDEDFFSGNTKEVFYWAGFLAADGWVEPERNRLGLGLQTQDVGHLEKFKEALKSSHDICPFMDGTAYRIRFNSQKICSDLETRFNITGAKTFTYQMPEFEDMHLALEFLRGYVEGDGHIEKTASQKLALHICSANKQFLVSFREIMEIILGRPVLQDIIHQQNKKGAVFSLRFKIDDSMYLIKELYKNSTPKTRLDRKYKVVKEILG